MKHLGDEFDKEPGHLDYTTFAFPPGRAAADFFTALGLDHKTVSADPVLALEARDVVYFKYTGIGNVSRETWDAAVALYLTALDVNS